MTAAADSIWLGSFHTEARAAFQRARNTGLSPMRALVIGSVASFRECWTFRRNLAAKVGCSIRTVQRALTQARQEGLIGLARAKKDERPPGTDRNGKPFEPLPCGWSHRWVVGWGQAGQKVADAVHAAKARWMVKMALAGQKTPATPTEPARAVTYAPRAKTANQRRTWTAAELDAELERLAAEKPPPT